MYSPCYWVIWFLLFLLRRSAQAVVGQRINRPLFPTKIRCIFFFLYSFLFRIFVWASWISSNSYFSNYFLLFQLGTNDIWAANQSSFVTEASSLWLSAQRNVTENAKIFVVIPFGQFMAEALTEVKEKVKKKRNRGRKEKKISSFAPKKITENAKKKL